MNGAAYFFNRMKKKHVHPSVITYNIMMNGFSKAKKADKVTLLFEEMLKTGIKPNVFVFATAIRACAINKDLKRALRLFSSMDDYRRTPCTKTYGALLHVCAVTGQLSLAKNVFTEMENEGVPRNAVIYNSLVDAYAEATDRQNGELHLEECRTLLRSMKWSGIHPDSYTFDLLIKICARGGLMKQGIRFLSVMERNGIQPNLITYGTLLDGLAKDMTTTKEKAAALLTQVLEEMQRRQLSPDMKMYGVLLNFCCKLGDLNQAEDFFHKAKKSGMQVNAVCYGAMIKCYEKLGDPSEEEIYLKPCFKLLKEIETRKLVLNNEMCTSLINACTKACDIDRACQVWSKAKEMEKPPDVILYDTMIRAFLKAHDAKGASLLIQEMEANGMDGSRLTSLHLLSNQARI